MWNFLQKITKETKGISEVSGQKLDFENQKKFKYEIWISKMETN